jgi:hypothetical protein
VVERYMLKCLFYIILSAFIFAPCVGLLVFSVWLASDRQKSSGNRNYTDQSPLTSEEAVELIKPNLKKQSLESLNPISLPCMSARR